MKEPELPRRREEFRQQSERRSELRPTQEEFDPYGWISTYYDLFYDRRERVDEELNQFAFSVLTELTTERNRGQIRKLKNRISRQRSKDAPEDMGRVRSYLDPLLGYLPSLRTRIQFERVLSITGDERALQEAEPHKYLRNPALAEQLDQRATERVQENARRSNELPESYREAAGTIREIHVTPFEVKKNLIQAEIASGDHELQGYAVEFEVLSRKITQAIADNSPQQLALSLTEHEQFITLIDTNEVLKGLRDRLPHFARMTKMQWQRYLPKVQEQLSIINEEGCLDLSLRRLIAKGIYDNNVHERIQTASIWQTIGKRLLQLELLENESGTSLSREERRILYGFVLADMTGRKEISSVLIEDIIDGKISLDEVNGLMLYDWIKTDSAWKTLEQEDFEKLDEKTKNDILKRILHQLKTGLSMAAVPFFLLAKLISAIPKPNISLPHFRMPRIPLPKIPLPFGDMFSNLGDKLGFGKHDELNPDPFEMGGEGLSDRKVFVVAGFAGRHSDLYFRIRSVQGYTARKGWAVDNYDGFETQELTRPEDAGDGNHSQGTLAGSVLTRDRFWLLEPYGYQYIPQKSPMQIEKGPDGSLTVGDGMQLATETNRRHVELQYATDSRSLEEKYPFDTSAEANQQLFSSPSILPEEIQQFLRELDKSGSTKVEEAEEILEYIRDTFTYSLDPRNTSLYRPAKRRGNDALMQALFTIKKVKCDGAATVAIALLRSRGIPARQVSGYVLPPGETEILAKHAHAWVEYFVDGEIHRGDPTPSIMDDFTEKAKRERGMGFDFDWEEFMKSIMKDHYAKKKYFEDITSANNLVSYLLAARNPSVTFHSLPATVIHYPKDYVRASDQQRAAMAQRVEHDIAVLEQMRDRSRSSNMGRDEIIKELEAKHIVTEREIIRVQVIYNFSQMLEPAIMSLFRERGVLDESFLRAWVSREDGYFTRLVGPHLVNASNAFITGNVPIRTSDGAFSTEFLDCINRSLEKVFRGIKPWASSKDQTKGFNTALAEERRKYDFEITNETIASHDLAILYASFIESLKLLAD